MATQTMSNGMILKIQQSLKSDDIFSIEISVPILLKTATPPRGVRDSMGLDLSMKMKSLGHLSRMFRWVSLMMIMSNWLKSVWTSSAKNLFFIPFIFQHKILHRVLKSCKLALKQKTD